MQLDQITANIRLRSSWEAVDLGFAMVQTGWKSIYPPLVIFNLLFLVPLFLFVPVEYDVYILLFFWWVKPYSHGLILHILSRKLFNTALTTKQALRDIPSLIKNTNMGVITFRRFSFSRGFNLPIWQLEGLTGKSRAYRQKMLLGAVHSEAIWLTIGLAAIGVIMSVSLIIFVLLFIPATHFDTVMNSLYSVENGISSLLHYVFYSVFILVTLLIEPFYIAASFALYINRRTQLEAWDIELAFRKMAVRLEEATKKLLSLFAVCTLSLFMMTALFPQNSYAEGTTSDSPAEKSELRAISQVDYVSDVLLPASTSKETIDDIINTKELKGETERYRWQLKDFDQQNEEDDDFDAFEGMAKFIAILLESILWVLLVIGLVLLYITREKWLLLLRPDVEVEDEYEIPEVLFGMDVRKASLPDDILSSAKALWQAQKTRESLSLLYRAALIQLLDDNVVLERSETEGDILKLSQKCIAEDKYQYLARLTTAWQLIAYAHRVPSDNDIVWLFDHWQGDFVSASAVEATS